MVAEGECVRCGSPIPEAAPEGECPACLLQLTLDLGRPGRVGGRGRAPAPGELDGQLPNLEFLEFVGRGGMGLVYKARQKDLDRIVAVKLLDPERAADPLFCERFFREAQAMARLSHRHIVGIYGVERSADQVYMTMEFVDGASLRDCLATGRLAPAEALRLIPQLCDAMQYAHDAGVVHRDIKPENVLIDAAGNVKIADFGLAKFVEGESYTLTGSGERMGTARYMAPEQWSNTATVDHRADIYSLGVMFYEMLTGDLPTPNFRPPSAKAETDPRLDHVVERSLREDPEERYQKAVEVKRAVQRIATTPAWRTRGRVAVLLTALVAFAAVILSSIRPPRDSWADAPLFSSDWQWTAPENLGPGINTDEAEQTPYISPDGLTLLFASRRPGGEGDHDLYECRRESIDLPLSAPVNLGPTVNSPHVDESPCLAADGLTLYFVSTRPPGGNARIWIARRTSRDAPWGAPESLGPEVNSQSAQYRPWISHDELSLTFTTLRTGRNEVWVSRRRSKADPFQPAVPMAHNSPAAGIGNVSFAVGGHVVMIGRLNALFPGNLLWLGPVRDRQDPFRDLVSFGPTVNSQFVDSMPTATDDGRIVVFESNRPGGAGSYDLWLTRRVRN